MQRACGRKDTGEYEPSGSSEGWTQDRDELKTVTLGTPGL